MQKRDKTIDLKEMLWENGYNFTGQRQVILDVFLHNEGKHLSSEEIYELAKGNCPKVGRATVYRALPILVEMAIIRKVYLDDNCKRYVLNIHNGKHLHHHLICMKCALRIELEGDFLDFLNAQIHKKNCFAIENHSVKIYGYCQKCSKVLITK